MYFILEQKVFVKKKHSFSFLAPTLAKEEMDWTKKKDYAKIPNYLLKVKEHLQKEYETVREFQKKEEEQKLKEKS